MGIESHIGAQFKNRIIGTYESQIAGPLLIAMGGIHGNEPAGVLAIENVLNRLFEEPSKNPDFLFKGNFIGLLGNVKAFNQQKRFIKEDLNRIWTADNIQKIRASDYKELGGEDQELFEIIKVIEGSVQYYNPTNIVFLDLHTTTANGGIFTIVTDDSSSEFIGKHLHAPVVKGLLEGINGTTLQYFRGRLQGKSIVSVCFESGQHNDPNSVENAVSAIISCLRTIGCVEASIVEIMHDKRLLAQAKNLPKVTSLAYCHRIEENDRFEMKGGYTNFQSITKGEWLASDKNGKILAPFDGLILMPLYQKQGNDGFFIVKSEDD